MLTRSRRDAERKIFEREQFLKKISRTKIRGNGAAAVGKNYFESGNGKT